MSENENKNIETVEFQEIADKYVVDSDSQEAPKPSFNWNEGEKDAPPPPKGFSIASMAMGILSIVCCCGTVYSFFFLFPLIFAILALVFKRIAKKKGATDGMATAGMICGIVGIILSVLGLVYTVLVLLEMIENFDELGSTLIL